MDGQNDKSFSIIVSSTDTQTSFTEERIREGQSDPTVMVVRATTWQTKPGRFKGGKFWVYKGSEKLDPFLEDDKDSLLAYFKTIEHDRCDIEMLPVSLRNDWIQVPDEFKKQFSTNVIRALADIAGIAVGKSGRLLSSEDALSVCFSKDSANKHPFTKDRFVISYQSSVRVEDFLYPDFMFDRKKKHYVHIDQSLSQDSTGLAISHKDVDKDGEFIVVDLMLKIDPPVKPDQISVRKLREFLFYLKDKRDLNIGLLTYDQFASAESIQEANNHGVEAEKQSVDRDCSQYDLLVDLILRKRIRSYYYKPFRDEILFLERDNIRHKVDHVKGFAKDISDAVAGSVFSSWVYGKKNFGWANFIGD
jgi:hypothetical protein